jgi:predicted phage terminase large subunit-like protein
MLSATERLLSLPAPVLEAIRDELGPRFANDQQRAFFTSQVGEVLYSGAFGAGKSRILCEKAYALGMRYPGAPIGIFRKVAASLAATTKLTFLRDVVPAGQIVRSNKTEGWYELANGSRFWFLGLDPDPVTGIPSKVGSLDLAFAFVDEAVEVTEADWMMLLGRLRFPNVPFHQIGAATNPADPSHWLKRRFDAPSTDRLMLHARTTDNRMLPLDYRERMAAFSGLYGARYVQGQWISVAGPLWNLDMIQPGQAPEMFREGKRVPDFQRIVVGVDPAATSAEGSDETGIVVAGLGRDGIGYVLDDRSCRLPPAQWAGQVVAAYRDFAADRIVAEVNNGGEMVETVIRAIGATVAYSAVHASHGKRKRAEPVAALYERGKVRHSGDFGELTSQMVGFDPAKPNGHDDRVDALVWAMTELFRLDDQGWGAGASWGSGAAGAVA